MSYVVLALVGQGGAGAHDLVKMAVSGERLYYAGAASKIYERAARLADGGYLAAERRPGKTRERTFYTLTEKGLEALRDWIEQPSDFPRYQSDALTRVFAGDLAREPAAVVRSVRALLPQIEELRRELEEDERRAAELPHRSEQLRLTRSLASRLLEAHREWIEEVERALGDPGDQPPAATAS